MPDFWGFRRAIRNSVAAPPPPPRPKPDLHITDSDLKRGIARASARLHMPVTRMVSRVIREEVEAARARRIAGEPEPRGPEPEAKRLARAILRGEGA